MSDSSRHITVLDTHCRRICGEEMGLDQSEAYAIESSVMNNCFSYVMDRKSLFHKIDVDDLVAKYAVRERLTASYTLYIIMMSVFVISFFYKGNSDIFRARAKLSGIRTWKIFLLESGCAAVMIYLLYILVFVCLCSVFWIHEDPGAVHGNSVYHAYRGLRVQLSAISLRAPRPSLISRSVPARASCILQAA